MWTIAATISAYVVAATDTQFGVVHGFDRGNESMQPSQIVRLDGCMTRPAIGLTGML